MRAHTAKASPDLQRKGANANGRTDRNAHTPSHEGAEASSDPTAILQRMAEGSAASLQLKEMAELASASAHGAGISAFKGMDAIESPLQRSSIEEEEPMQGRFAEAKAPLQKAAVEEEEPMQGRFTKGVDALQRAALEEEEPMQGRFAEAKAPLQKAAVEEEEPMQGRFAKGVDALQRAAMEEEEPMQGRFTNTVAQAREAGAGSDSDRLPEALKSGVENLSGQSLDDVKVHYNSQEPSQMEAHAFAQGSDIHVASGQEKHLPHEAWHVAQQKQGRVQPTTLMNGGVPVNDDPKLESEADAMGARSLAKGSEILSQRKRNVE